ncbi:MAG: RidA family protein [Phycisphaerales bacterium]|nr:RidA family protein [Phycisphaerales bacterium]
MMVHEARRAFLRSLSAVLAVVGITAGVADAQTEDRTGQAGRRRAIGGGSRYFSRAVAFERMVFVSGVLGRDEAKGALVAAEFEPQCRQALSNLKASVEAAGSSLDKVLQCTCFLTDTVDFVIFNQIYAEFFMSDPPARSTVVVKELVVAGAKIEIDCVAHT